MAFKGDFQTNKYFLPQLVDKIGHAEKKELSGLTNLFLDCKREVGVEGNEGKKKNSDLKKKKKSRCLGILEKDPAGEDIKLE